MWVEKCRAIGLINAVNIPKTSVFSCHWHDCCKLAVWEASNKVFLDMQIGSSENIYLKNIYLKISHSSGIRISIYLKLTFMRKFQHHIFFGLDASRLSMSLGSLLAVPLLGNKFVNPSRKPP